MKILNYKFRIINNTFNKFTAETVDFLIEVL